jgi:uncharacterized protein
MSESVDTWEIVAAALGDGRLLEVEPGHIATHETHISLVFVAGDYAWKLKKRGIFDVVDYSTAERRREMCFKEFRLNRRLAPDIYLRVIGVAVWGTETWFCDPADPQVTECVLVMQRLDAGVLLDSRVNRLEATTDDLRSVGRRLGRFHVEAAAAPASQGSPEVVRDWGRQRLRAVQTGADGLLDSGRIEAVALFFERWLDSYSASLSRRTASGYVRDGHGDLRLEHIVMTQPIQILDCVEFDDSLRQADVLSDIAFMVMELQLAAREDLSSALLEGWSEVGGPLETNVLWFYAVMRALVRVEVALTRSHQLPPGFRRELVEQTAIALLSLAVRLSWRPRQPRAILIGGLSGSGKTSISLELAERWGLPRFSSDMVRKRLVGLGPEAAAPPEAYQDWVSRLIYDRLGREAGRAVVDGQSILIDATFRQPDDTEAFREAYRATGAKRDLVCLLCTVEETALRERVISRSRAGGSDADLPVLEEQLRSASRPFDGASTLTLRTDAGFSETLSLAEQLIVEITL